MPAMTHSVMAPAPRQAGLTLVELLVALVIGMLIAIAAYASLLVARQGFGSVSATAELRDNARFATSLLQRLATQAGYKDDYNASYAQASETQQGFNFGGMATQTLFVQGYDASRARVNAGVLEGGATNVVNDSDVLILRALAAPRHESATEADGSMVNCLGVAHEAADKLIQNALFVAASPSDNNEPNLMCLSTNKDGAWNVVAQPLVSGVETFQVLYGINTESTGTTANAFTDGSRFRYLSAADVESSSNWENVRSLRIGMVMRAKAGSGLREVDGSSTVLYPLGERMQAANGGEWTDPNDGRIRQTVTFTVQLRNNLNPPGSVHSNQPGSNGSTGPSGEA